MAVIYRPVRGGLAESMEEVRVFESFSAMQEWVANDHKPYLNIRPEEIIPLKEPVNDDRTGWVDTDYLCVDAYQNIEDKASYIRYFGAKYDHPLCIGYYATTWNQDQTDKIKASDPIADAIRESLHGK